MTRGPAALRLALFWGLVLAAATAIACWHPRAPEWSMRTDLSIGADRIPDDVLFVDVRRRSDFDLGHAEGAVWMDAESGLEHLPDLLERWSPDQAIVVYCDGGGCHASREVVERLRAELGSDRIWYLRGGWPTLRMRR